MARMLAFALWAGLVLVAEMSAQGPAPASGRGRSLGDFEAEADVGLWKSSTAQLSRSDEQAATGSHSLKAVLPAGVSYPGISAGSELLGDWSGYDLLTFQVYNPSQSTVGLNLRIDDDQSTDAYQTQFNTGVQLTPGWNRFRFVVGQLRAVSGRPINLRSIKALLLFIGQRSEPTTLYFDDIKLAQLAGKLAVPRARAFDFGTPDSPVWPGFTRVTAAMAYSKEQGFGWTTPTVEQRDRERPDDLARDLVFSRAEELGFALDLPEGEYVVWLLSGDLSDSGWSAERSVTVSIQGREVAHLDRPGGSLSKIRYRDRDFPSTEQKPIYDTFIAPRFTEVWADTKVTGGQLKVALRPGQAASLCALVVAPKEQAEPLRQAITQLNQARREQFGDDCWREVKHLDTTPAPVPSAADDRRGFLLFLPNPQRLIYANTQPTPAEMQGPLRGAAARGEYEPMVLAIRPLRDLGALSVELSELKGPGAATITATDIDIRMVQYHAVVTSGFHHGKGGTFECKPWFLVPQRGIDAQAGVDRSFWLTVHVPTAAPAGVYRGEARVLVGATAAATVPVEFEVYPFALDYPPDVAYAHWWSWPAYEELLEPSLRNIYEHGERSLTPSGIIRLLDQRDPQGRVQLDLSRADRLMAAAKAVGFTGPMPLVDLSIQGAVSGNSYSHLGLERRFSYGLDSPGYFADMAEMCRAIKEHAAQAGWLPVLYYSATELSSDESLGPAYHEKLLKAMKSAGDIKTISSINRPEDLQTLPWLDCVMLNNAVPINAESIAKVKAAGSVLWYQNVGGNRFIEGLYLWRTGAKGHRQFWLSGYQGDPFNDFDGEEVDTASFLLPSADGWIGTISWEWMREGVDDYCYLFTLSALISRGLKAGGQAAQLAQEAQAAVDEQMSHVPVDFGDAIKTYDDGWSENSGPLTPEAYDRFRRKVADFIVRLREATGAGAAGLNELPSGLSLRVEDSRP
jgi:hypothetical protein